MHSTELKQPVRIQPSTHSLYSSRLKLAKTWFSKQKCSFFSDYSTVSISGPPSVTYTVCSNWQILPPSAQAKT